ncbi:MAG: PEP-CTERM sorting domain-containing protein [Bryobacteraceae bacterium]
MKIFCLYLVTGTILTAMPASPQLKSTNAVPEPATYPLVTGGLLVVGGLARRRVPREESAVDVF